MFKLHKTLRRCLPASAALLLLPAVLCGQAVTLLDPGKAGSLSFSWRQLAQGTATFSLYNSGAAGVAGPVTVTPLSATRLAPGTPNQSKRVGISPAALAVFPYSAQAFALTVNDPVPSSGIYVGAINFPNGAGGTASLTVSVMVPGPEPVAAKDAVTLWRLFPLPGNRFWLPREVRIPTTYPIPAGGLGNRPAGAIVRASGGWTTVHWNQPACAGQPDLVVNDAPAAGTYAGDLTLAEDPAKVTYNLTVTAKDIVVWPIVVIAVGIWLAYMVKRYIGVLRVTWTLRLQESAIAVAFRQAQMAFLETAHGQPFAAYSIAANVAALRQAVRASLTQIEKSPASVLDSNNSQYQSILTNLTALQNGIAQWPDLATTLDELSTSLAACGESIVIANIEPPNDPGEPAFFASARQTLQGAAVTLAGLPGIQQNAAALLALAKLWPAARQHVADLTALYRSLNQPGLPPAIAGSLSIAQGQVVGLWVQLWAVTTADNLQAMVTNVFGTCEQLA